MISARPYRSQTLPTRISMRIAASCLRLLMVPVAAALLGAGVSRADGGPSTARLGKSIENVTLRDAAGTTWALHDQKDRKAVVVVFLSFECPVSTSYAQPLADMATAYGKQGI